MYSFEAFITWNFSSPAGVLNGSCIFESLYDTNNAKLYVDFFKTAPYETYKDGHIYHFPIFSEDRLFGVCIVQNIDGLDDIKSEYIKVALNAASILLRDIYR